MENCFPTIVGNRRLAEQLAGEIRCGRFPHAYILAGPTGSGKHTLALQIAAALACESTTALPCAVCDSCRKILGGFSPDILFYKKEDGKTEFTVDIIRQIKSTLYISPNELQKRVYILEDAENMNISAQNAFLKMLEEPPSYVVFLLLCTDPELLLETVRSRAPVLRLESIPQDLLRSYLIEHSAKARAFPQERLSAVLQAANGSIGKALALCEDDSVLQKIGDAVDAFLSAATSPSFAGLGDFSDTLGNDPALLCDFFAELKAAIRDLAVYKQDEGCTLLHFPTSEKAEAQAEKWTVAKLLAMERVIEYSESKLQFHIDIRVCASAFCADTRKIMTR